MSKFVVKEFTPDQIVHAMSEYVMRRRQERNVNVETTCVFHYVVNEKSLNVRIEGARVETKIEEAT